MEDQIIESSKTPRNTARHLAIIERRTLRKQRTKTRNEKINTDRIAAREERRRMKAERGAICYTLACSCRLCGVNFFDYLKDYGRNSMADKRIRPSITDTWT